VKDKANIDAASFQKDILSDEKVLIPLPIFFRTLKRKTYFLKNLDKLIDMIRKE